MQTANNDAGRKTEQIMADWLRRLVKRGEPQPSAATYNAAYEAVFSVLSESQPSTGRPTP